MIKSTLRELLARKEYFLFDLDGTLIDSSSCHAAAFEYAITLYAPRLLAAFNYERCKGLRTDDVFRQLQVEDANLIKKLTETKQLSYRQKVESGQVRPFPHVHQLLTALKDDNRKLSLVTSASRRSAEAIMDNLELRKFFDAVITGEDVARAKPAPDGYLACINQLGLQKEKALVIEDADSGIEAARNAGLEVIAVNNVELAGRDEYVGTIADIQCCLF